jgi:hypothetical protein
MKLGLALVATLALAVPSSAQSLGDLAKKTQEDRDKARAAPTPAKIYSDKDLKDAPPVPADKPAPAPVAPATSPSAETKKTDGKPSATDKESAKDEAYWRARWTPIGQKLAGEQARSARIRSRIADLTFELSGVGPLNARRGGLESERQRLITEGQALDDTISADKAMLAAIEEEGRRAGALPGWFR